MKSQQQGTKPVGAVMVVGAGIGGVMAQLDKMGNTPCFSAPGILSLTSIPAP